MPDRSHATTFADEMHVCRRCGELAGAFIDPRDERIDRTQRCACSVAARGSDEDAVWPRYDFNTVVEICFCCCAEVIQSGFYVSPLFCSECAPLVEKMNARDGVAIPSVRPVKPRPTAPGGRTAHKRSGIIPRTGAITRLGGRRREVITAFISDRFARHVDPTVATFLASRAHVSREDAATELANLFRGWRADDPTFPGASVLEAMSPAPAKAGVAPPRPRSGRRGRSGTR